MKASSRPLVPFLVCGLFGVFGLPAVAMAEELQSGAGPSLSGSPTIVPGAESLTGGQQQAEEARLDNPEAVAQREASTSAYEGLGPAEAEKLVDQSFPGRVDNPVGGPPQLPAGEKATGFPTDNAMSIELAGGKRAVVEALAPIAMGDTAGGRQPIELGLSESSGAFRAKRALVEVQVPKHLNEATTLEESGVSLTPVTENGAALGAAEGVIDGASVFYGDSEDAQAGVTDLDTLVKPTTAGFEVQSVLRSQRSPERLYFKVGLPVGASLVEESGGTGVQVVKEGEAIASIPPTVANDSQGTVVPVTMEVSRNVLTLNIARKPGQYDYPIIVDPQVSEETLTGEHGQTHWKFGRVGTKGFSARGLGGLEPTITGLEYTRGESGYLEYQTQGESKIWEAKLETSGSNFGHVETDEQIVHLEGREEISEDTFFLAGYRESWEPSTETLCAEHYILGDCPLGGQSYGAHHNLVKLQVVALGTETASSRASLSKADLSIYQEHGPSEPTVNTTSPTLDGTQNVFYGKGGWLSEHSGAYMVEAKDPGIGISSLSIAAGSWEVGHNFYEEGKCEGVQCSPAVDEIFTYNSKLPNGEDSVEVVTQDATKEYSPTMVKTLKVDNAPPYDLGVKGMPPGNEIGEGIQHIDAEATDGSGTTHSSGIKSISIEVDGGAIGTPNGSCPEGPCTAKGEWTLDGGEFGAGEHTLTIVATDNAGNQEKRNISFTVRHGKPAAFATGSLAPESGDYSLGATDVSMGDGLTFSREYSSRNLTAGVMGPLGPQWSTALTGDQGLVELPNGNVLLTSASGGLTSYKSKGGGAFEGPKGDANITLTLAEKEKVREYYLLVDASAGTVVKFTMPSGGGNTWVPAAAEGPTMSEAVTYTYQTIENSEHVKVTEPKEAFAPDPAKASCTPTPEPGCRKLTFVYAEKTTAKGENESEWGEYLGQMSEVLFTTYDPVSKEMKTKAVAEYSYDKQGRLRAEWDPRISPALKTVYGYDTEGHVTALTKPGQETWAFTYGTIPADAGPGRLLKATQAPASVKLWSGEAPKNTVAPKVAGSALVGVLLSVSNGTWSNEPVAYSYQWEDCNSEGKECTIIPGATNANYTLAPTDVGHVVVAMVGATNGGGTTVASSTPTTLVKADEVPEYPLVKGSWPEGIAAQTGGYVWIAEYLADKIAKVSSSGSVTEYGPLPTNSYPYGITAGPEGDMWFTDLGSDKIGKITSSGTITEYTTKADELRGIVEGPDGNLWFTEGGDNKIGKMTPSGTVTDYTLASGDTTPYGITAGPDGNLWFSIWGTHGAIGKVTTSGTVKEYEVPSSTGPGGIVAGPDENLWFTEPGSSKIGKITTSGTVSEYALPSGSRPYGIVAGADHNLWFTESETNKLGKITTAGVVNEYPVTSKDEPTWLTSGSEGDVWFEGPGSGEVGKINPSPAEGERLTPGPGSTIEYQVPLSGTGLPNLTEKEAEKWGQKDDPVEAVAIFPPDEPQGWPALDYKRATISYFDGKSREVNVASPSGGVATSEYDEADDVVRSLSANNRSTALKEGSKSAEVAKLLDTESAYNEEGDELLETTGPQHMVKLAGGSEVEGRNHVKYFYDEGAPEGEKYRLVTKTADSALVAGKEEEPRTIKTYYSGENNLGWLLRKPTSVVTNPEGLKLTSTTVYDPTTGSVIETRGSEGSGTPSYVSEFGTDRGGHRQFNWPEDIAIDGKGNIWVADTYNERVQEFSASGEYLNQFGSWGTGEGQMEYPKSIAIDSKGDVWIVDSGANRVEEFSETGAYIRAFGGEGTDQLKSPEGLALNGKGDVWVVDSGDNRLEEFTEAGVYVKQVGSEGTGNEQFKSPRRIAIDSKGNLWVTDGKNCRVMEFGETGKYEAQFGKCGSSHGEFNEPQGLKVDSNGNIWVTDENNDRVQEFNEKHEFVQTFGTEGTGNGDLVEPEGLALDTKGDVWVIDSGNFRAEEFSSTGTYMSQFGTHGSPLGALHGPKGVAIDSKGDKWVADTNNSRILEFSPSGESILSVGSEGTGPGQLEAPRGVAIDSKGDIWVVDQTNDRIEEYESTGKYVREFGGPGKEPGQLEEPQGIAIDKEGNIWVADTGNHRIQEFGNTGTPKTTFGIEGEGRGDLKEPKNLAIDANGNIWVSDAWNDKIEEFNTSGTLIGEFGKYGSAPGQFHQPQGIAIDQAGDIWVVDSTNSRVQEFTPSGGYLAQFGTNGSGNGQFNEPRAIALDSTGHAWIADSNNNRIEQWTIATAHAAHTIYYSSEANPAVPACGKHPEWANLPCQTMLGAQPVGGLPELPITTLTYNTWDETEKTEETFGTGSKAVTRNKIQSYDPAGRALTSKETSSSTTDTTLPEVTNEYNSTTGLLEKQTTPEGTVTSKYNKLGQLIEYTDAGGNVAKYTYEEGSTSDVRLKEVSESKGKEAESKQTYSYDTTTGFLTKLGDSEAGTFTASYDAEGRMISETYPNNMTASDTVNSLGQTTGLIYEKNGHCATKCPETWFSDSVSPSIHGETLHQASTFSTENYAYDNAGRLLETQETPAGKGCVTRLYAYDEESNRTSLASREPGTEGKCASEGGTVERHTYDEANRLADENVTYEDFDNIVKLPTSDAGGHELTSTYYVDGQIATQEQNKQLNVYKYDPVGRTAETASENVETKTKTTTVSHYAGPGSALTWTSEGTEKWTRNIPGIDGSLAAIRENSGTVYLQLHDLQGDIIGKAALSETETKLLSPYNSTEFGVPTTSNPPKYSWLGADGVASELTATGVSTQNGSSYVPEIGRPLQTGPIASPGSFPNGTASVGIIDAPYLGAATGQLMNIAIQENAAREEAKKREAEEQAALNAIPGSATQAPEEEDPCGVAKDSGQVEFLGAIVLEVWANIRWCWTKHEVVSVYGDGKGELVISHWWIPWAFKFLRWEEASYWEGENYIVERTGVFWGQISFCGIDEDGTGPPICPGKGDSLNLTFVFEPNGQDSVGYTLSNPPAI
jgi:YD repeat-containing protein